MVPGLGFSFPNQYFIGGDGIDPMCQGGAFPGWVIDGDALYVGGRGVTPS